MKQFGLYILFLILVSCKSNLAPQNQSSEATDRSVVEDENSQQESNQNHGENEPANNRDEVPNEDGNAQPGSEPVINPPPIAAPNEDDSTDLDDGLEYSKPKSCTKIDFQKLKWPEVLLQNEIDLFATALNISGSFEGNRNWSNLSNNFDGMGLSMGLLNQTLGTGSLQSLLNSMRTNHAVEFKSFFSTTRYSSLISMLNRWTVTASGQQKISQDHEDILSEKLSEHLYEDISDQDMFADNGKVLSPLDEAQENVLNSDLFLLKSVADRNSESVSWAVKNLYNGSQFKPEWKTELIRLSEALNYKKIQLQAAKKLHDRALFFFQRFKFSEVRSYLLMFDFIVQNGGFYQKNIDEYDAFLKNNPRASESTKLNRLLEIRLKNVRKQYVNDVKNRKSAIINGSGKVHGSSRNLPKEFCYMPSDIYTK